MTERYQKQIADVLSRYDRIIMQRTADLRWLLDLQANLRAALNAEACHLPDLTFRHSRSAR